MVVVFDLGHTGRTGGRKGAEFEGMREVSIVRRYVARAADLLEEQGVTVEICGFGSYSSRQSLTARRGASAYVSCHVNAGWSNGKGPAVFHTASALGGRRLAVCLRDELDEMAGSCRIWQTTHEDWTRNAHALINTAQTGRVPAVVFEPVFIDAPHHRDFCEQPNQIGETLAAGLLVFLGLS